MNPDAQDLLSATSNTANKKLCITYSCCSFGIFSATVWSETTCTTIVSHKNVNTRVTVINLKTDRNAKYSQSDISIANDIVIPAAYDVVNGEADVDVLKAGRYQVIDGQLVFTPVTQRIRVTCLITTHDGTIFGNPYHFTTGVCVIHLWPNKGANNNGFLTLDISNDANLIDLASRNNGTLRFDQDITISNASKSATSQTRDGGIVIKAGTYTVNDNKIYIQNYETK
jgi:hypothetical protein